MYVAVGIEKQGHDEQANERDVPRPADKGTIFPDRSGTPASDPEDRTFGDIGVSGTKPRSLELFRKASSITLIYWRRTGLNFSAI